MPESTHTGGRKPRVSDGDLLDVVRSTDDPVLSTAEVADDVPIKRRGVLNRLGDLADAGELESKQIGGRNTVWWIPDHGDADTFDADGLQGDPSTTLAGESGEDAARADAGADATDAPADPPADAHGADAGGERDARDTARERIEELDVAGSGADYDRRRDAVLTMYDHLRDRPGERLKKSDFEDLLDGVDVGYGGGFESLWSNWVKADSEKGRPNTLGKLPGVEPGHNDYVFRPEGDR